MLIKGDTEASYSAVMAVMDDLRKAGIEDIGLITEPKTPPNQQAGGKSPWPTYTSISAPKKSSRAKRRTPVRT